MNIIKLINIIPFQVIKKPENKIKLTDICIILLYVLYVMQQFQDPVRR